MPAIRLVKPVDAINGVVTVPAGSDIALEAEAPSAGHLNLINYVRFYNENTSSLNAPISPKIYPSSDGSTDFNYTWANIPYGDYVIYAGATDDVGRIGSSQEVSRIRALALPEVHLDDEIKNGIQIRYGEDLEVSGSLNSQNSGVTINLSVEIQGTMGERLYNSSISRELGERELIISNQGQWSLSDLDLPPGAYSITFRAVDSLGTEGHPVTIPLDIEWNNLAIDFLPSSATSLVLEDHGDAFGLRGDGLSYGWDANRTTKAIEREIPTGSSFPPSRYTYIPIESASYPYQWEVDVPNGFFTVKIVSGEPDLAEGDESEVYSFEIEEEDLILGSPTPENLWREGEISVLVRDGRLTIKPSVASRNGKLNYIEINQVAFIPEASGGTKLYSRGAGSAAESHSFVIPLDDQLGVQPLPYSAGGNELVYHLNAEAHDFPIEVNQPVVEFGEEVGGTALYPKRSYRFGVYAGDNRGIVGPEVRIKVFDGSDQFQGTISIDIPSPIDGSEWNDFQNAGYTTGAITSDVDDYNLRTAVSYVSQGTEWGLSPDFDYGAFILTHFAQNDGYRYEIEVKGRAPMAMVVSLQ